MFLYSGIIHWRNFTASETIFQTIFEKKNSQQEIIRSRNKHDALHTRQLTAVCYALCVLHCMCNLAVYYNGTRATVCRLVKRALLASAPSIMAPAPPTLLAGSPFVVGNTHPYQRVHPLSQATRTACRILTFFYHDTDTRQG